MRIMMLALAAMLASLGTAQNDKGPIRRRIAEAYGLAGFAQVDRLEFTFNVKLGDREIHRHWTWEPKTGKVTFRGKDEKGAEQTVSYVRAADAKDLPADAKAIDPMFVNDQFWLLFPFHLVWDDSATVEETGEATLPIGEGKAPRVLVKYPASSGGYTPGDHYEAFLAPDLTLVQWSYHKGGGAEGKPATWEGYAQVGPLRLSLEHRGPNDFHLWFTDVAADLSGSGRIVPRKE
jgi:hypothetical protein